MRAELTRQAIAEVKPPKESQQKEQPNGRRQLIALASSWCGMPYRDNGRADDHRFFASPSASNVEHMERSASVLGDYVFFFKFSATAARMSFLKAASLILSPSWISMARRTVPGCVKR